MILTMAKRVLVGSIVVAGVVAALAAADLATGLFFARSMLMDALFIASAGLVIYLALDAIRDLK